MTKPHGTVSFEFIGESMFASPAYIRIVKMYPTCLEVGECNLSSTCEYI